jgi:16S rRNA (cytidine1402-2'-O)-methyltransferase
VLGDRASCVARNLTKPHERYQRGSLSSLLAELRAEGEVRGECTLVVAGASDTRGSVDDAEADARLLLQRGAPARAVQEFVAVRHDLSKRDAYAMVLRLRER